MTNNNDKTFDSFNIEDYGIGYHIDSNGMFCYAERFDCINVEEARILVKGDKSDKTFYIETTHNSKVFEQDGFRIFSNPMSFQRDIEATISGYNTRVFQINESIGRCRQSMEEFLSQYVCGLHKGDYIFMVDTNVGKIKKIRVIDKVKGVDGKIELTVFVNSGFSCTIKNLNYTDSNGILTYAGQDYKFYISKTDALKHLMSFLKEDNSSLFI